MATLSNPVYYYNQTTQWPGDDGGYVGWGGNSSGLTGGNCTRIVRYTLTTGAYDYASAVNIKMISNDFLKWAEGNSKADTLSEILDVLNDEIDLYFIIGTSATEHIKAGRDYVSNGNYTGKAYIQSYFTSTGESKLDNLRFNIELNCNYNLSPNSTYYVWIFPGYAYADGTYGLFRWDDRRSTTRFSNTVTLTAPPGGFGTGAEITAVSDFTDETNPTITYSYDRGSRVESVTLEAAISFDGTKDDIPYRPISATGTSYTFPLTSAERSKLWPLLNNGPTATVRFYIRTTETVAGETKTFYKYLTKTFKFVNYTPTLDTDVYDTDTDTITYLTGNNRILVRHVSRPYFKTGGQARKGATITTQYCAHGGVTKTGATGEFTTVSGDDTKAQFDFAITDSYGRTHQETMEFSTNVGNYVPYIKLTCSTEVIEMTAEGEVQVIIRGKCFTGNFGKKVNRLRVNYDIAKGNEDFDHVDLGYADYASNYGNSFYVNGNDYTYTLNITGLDYLSVYDLTVRVSDEVAVEGVPASTILAATPVFDWGKNDFNFNVPVTIQGATVPSIVTQVLNDNGWSYRKWSDGTAECWRTLSVTAAVSTSTNASWYSSGELSATNLSFPFTFAARPSVTVQTMPTGQSWCIVFPSNTTGSTSKTGSYQLNSMSSTTSRTHLLSYDVKGRWK